MARVISKIIEKKNTFIINFRVITELKHLELCQSSAGLYLLPAGRVGTNTMGLAPSEATNPLNWGMGFAVLEIKRK